MKKINLLAVMLLLATIGFSQEKVKFGIHAGINVSNERADGNASGMSLSATNKTKVGLNVGVDVPILISNGFYLQPELSYSQLGGGESNDGGKDNLSYLDIPVLVKYKLHNSGLGFYFGPQLGVLVAAKSKVNNVSVDIKDYVKSTDFSLVFGAEYYFTDGFGLSARFRPGLTNIAKDNVLNVLGVNSLKNQAFTFTVGYRF